MPTETVTIERPEGPMNAYLATPATGAIAPLVVIYDRDVAEDSWEKTLKLFDGALAA